MKLAHLKQPDLHKEDVKRIVDVFASYGILISETDSLLGWGIYSETKDEKCEWTKLPEKDEDIYLALVDYLKIENW